MRSSQRRTADVHGCRRVHGGPAQHRADLRLDRDPGHRAKAASLALTIDWTFADTGETHRTQLSNGAFAHWVVPASDGAAHLRVTLTKPRLPKLLAGDGLAGISHEGDASVLDTLFGVLDAPEPAFAIVTP